MLGINEKLNKLQSENKTINVAVAGIGQMGSSIVSHLNSMKAFKVCAISNRNVQKSYDRIKTMGYDDKDIHVVEKNSVKNEHIKNELYSDLLKSDLLEKSYVKTCDKTCDEMTNAIKSGKVVFTDSLMAMAQTREVDVIIDATGSPEAGAQISLMGIINKKHVVTLNVEADTSIGPFLKKMAVNYGVVYTVAAGDEPAALKELYDFATALNLDIVAAGKGKNNPLNRDANPESLEEYATQKGTSPKMMTSFVDGTKSMVEMACFSNATGIIPDCRGMHAPHADVEDLTTVFSLKKDGGILDKKGIVDFAIGNVAPGVFLVYSTKQDIIRKELKYLLFGDGPNYLLYRPFHLASIESPLSIARAYFYNEPTITPKNGMISEVITMAKKDLKKGDSIDGIGGYTVYGSIELYPKAKDSNLLPLGLSEGAVLQNEIKKGEPIRYEDVCISNDSVIYKLRKLQEMIIG
ncbi:MAG: SAF domain-containing protein [Actinobacteria bacterium]|nr:SAF domain-containing protein [Actinomycetota bacterium]